MDSKEVLEQALHLKPEERFLLVEGLLKSLDEPDERAGRNLGRRSGETAQGISNWQTRRTGDGGRIQGMRVIFSMRLNKS